MILLSLLFFFDKLVKDFFYEFVKNNGSQFILALPALLLNTGDDR